LEEFLNFTHIKARLKKTILIYGYGAGFFWAKGMNFSLVQISRFMDLLNFFLENIRDKHLSSEENFKELEKAIVAIGVTNPEQRDDLDFFSIEQAKAIIDYFVTSLFEHYKAYEFIFHYPKDNPMLSEE
ncbi:CBCO1 protein, partial [Serilophus lunatus]|nr:CBCO1 protein [Serilophus lunatus]